MDETADGEAGTADGGGLPVLAAGSEMLAVLRDDLGKRGVRTAVYAAWAVG